MENDRRIRRTRAAIQTAFLKLIVEKDINKITVKELCELADINKSTFYLHYRDMFDLAEHAKKQLAVEISNILLEYEIKDLIPKAAEIWERVCTLCLYDDMCLSLHDSALSFMSEALSTQVLNAILQKLEASDAGHDEEKLYEYRIFTTFIIHGFLGLLYSFDMDKLRSKDAISRISAGLENGLKL